MFRRLKPLVVSLVSFGALFFPCAAFATQITFSTPENTPLLYTLTAANLASYDPGGTFGIYDDTVCDTGTIATQHGGTANMDGGSPDTIYYTPPSGYVGNDTVTFYNTTDGVNCVAQQAIATVMAPAPAVTSLSPTRGTTAGSTGVVIAGSNFSSVTSVTFGGTNALNYVVNSSTQITATSPAHSATTVDVKVTTGSGTSAAVTADHYSYIPALVISTTTLPTPLLGHAYNQRVATTGGTTPITFSISSGSLPAGLSLDSVSGVISGTPTASGAYSFTVHATDSGTPPANQAYAGSIATLVTITPGTLSAPILNVAYNTTIPTSGGSGPITFGMYNGSTLPAGLSLNSATGVISGTPTVSGTFSFSIYATDGNSEGIESYSVTIVASLAITTATLPTPVLGVAYSSTVVTNGGTAPIAFSISSGLLPTGLSLNGATGAISGTPTASGAYSFSVRGTDSNAISASQAYSGTIAASLAITTATLPAPIYGVAYNNTILTSGGTAPIAFSISAGTLPAGLNLNGATGALGGTPTIAGAYGFTIVAADANSITASHVYSGTIAAGVSIATATLPTPLVGVAYSQHVVATGGTAPYTFSLSAGTLPAGLTLNSVSGAITGTPTAAGAYTFTVRATDNNALSASQAYSGAIGAGLAITTATLPAPLLGVGYSGTIVTSGGTAPIAFSISAGTLPTGLSLIGATGVLTGTPTAAGAYGFTILAADANSITASHVYSGTIAVGVSIATATLPTPLIGVAYSQHVVATGGTAPYTFSLSAGTLPPGLTLNGSSGYIAGTPTAAGAFSFTVRATDNNALSASQMFSGTIGAGLAITTATLPTPVLGVAYTSTVVTSGGTAPIAFSISAGALPTGLSLVGATGALTGTPAIAGAYSFTILATDVNSITANRVYSGTIAAGVSIGTSTLPTPFIGVTYSRHVVATGGTAPYTFSLSAGTLPPGLTLNSASGYVTGTPTAAGAYSFTVRVADTNALSASQTYSGTIAATLAIASVTLPAPEIGLPYNQIVATTGGIAPVTFSVAAGALPAGLTLDGATGAIAGTPTASGAYSYTVRVVDAVSAVASQAYSGTIGAVPSVVALSVNVGPTVGGTTVTITGTAFTGATAVLFGTTPATSFTLGNATSVTATSPPGSGSAAISVVTPGGTSAAGAAATFTWAAPPSVTGLSPEQGSLAGGTVVTITGHGFTRATAVYFGSVSAATFTISSDTSISATTAAATASLTASFVRASGVRKRPDSATPPSGVAVTVVTAGGTNPATPASMFVYVPAVVAVPTVVHLSPASGTSAGGTSVTITGTALGGTTAVRFGTAGATFSVVSPTTLTASAPAGSGSVNVTVTTPAGTSANTASYTYVAAATTAVVASSSNPAVARARVTFTATISSAHATPTGRVTFLDGATPLGTVALAGGVAALATSTLGIGTHAITVTYGGAARFAPSTSAVLAQSISVPADSVNLRALQLAATKLVAQASGQAISAAIDDAIGEGFSGDAPLITPSATGMKVNLAQGTAHSSSSDPVQSGAAGVSGVAGMPSMPGVPGRSRHAHGNVNDVSPPDSTVTPTPTAMPRAWLAWGELSTTGIAHTGTSDQTSIYGHQVDALAGITRRMSSKIVAGVLGGYESFDYRSDALAGRLTGNGSTVGAYLGWKFAPGLRFDLAGAYSSLTYDGVAGCAYATFPGSRFLASSGLIGTYEAKSFAVEPSAEVYALWERQSGYTDSLDTPQIQNTFATGRASAGAKITTLPKTESFIAPYAGFYAEYYFNADDGALLAPVDAVPLASERMLAGWSANAIAGFAAKFGRATTLTCGIDYGGIGSSTRVVKYHCAASVPLVRSKDPGK